MSSKSENEKMLQEVEKTNVELREAIEAAGQLAEKAQKLVTKIQKGLPSAECD